VIPERIVWPCSWLNFASPGFDQASQTVLHLPLLVHLPQFTGTWPYLKNQNIKMAKISKSK
jgi:hypothetical protein